MQLPVTRINFVVFVKLLFFWHSTAIFAALRSFLNNFFFSWKSKNYERLAESRNVRRQLRWIILAAHDQPVTLTQIFFSRWQSDAGVNELSVAGGASFEKSFFINLTSDLWNR